MSTNIPEDDFIEVPPDPESEILPEITAEDDLPALTPVFEDTTSELTARQLPEVYDEFLAVESLKAEEEDPPIPIGRTWMWDFEKSRFVMVGQTPQHSTEDEHVTLQQWIRRCLTTERYAYAIYPDWFGIQLEPVTTGEYGGQAAAEFLVGQIRDALLQHDRISEVLDIEVSEDQGTLWARFSVYLDRGTTIDVEQKILELEH